MSHANQFIQLCMIEHVRVELMLYIRTCTYIGTYFNYRLISYHGDIRKYM